MFVFVYCYSVRVTHIFKIKIKIICNNTTALIVDPALKKDRKFVEKAVRHFVRLTWWRRVQTVRVACVVREASDLARHLSVSGKWKLAGAEVLSDA